MHGKHGARSASSKMEKPRRRYESLLFSPWVGAGIVLSVVFWILVGYLVWRWLG